MPKKNKGGRPTKFTPETIQKLEHAFSMGCTDIEACFHAGISKSSLYSYQSEHPEFLDRKEALKSNPVLLARSVVIDALNDGDINTAHKVLDRKEGSKVDFNVSGELSVKNEWSLQPVKAIGPDNC